MSFWATLIYMINPPGCIVLPPRVVKIFQIRKFLWYDKSGRYFRFDHSALIEMEVVRNYIFKNSYLNNKLLFCTVLPPGASKVDQTHTFDDFLNLIQLFSITPYSVLVEINVVRNYVINNFKLHDKLSRMHSFHSKSLWSWQNSAISQEKIVFWSTLEAPSEKTVHL